MNHSNRAFSFAKIESENELVKAMFNHKWPVCYSFYYNNHLYLNDTESEDSPEYAIVAVDKTEGRFWIHGREVGRMNSKNMQAADALRFIHMMNEGKYDDESPVQLMAEPKWHHNCHLCGLDEE